MVGQVFAGRYELVDVLGRGGMGDVWRVWDLREGVYRAAKLQRQADSASLLRFVRESSTRVEHPHVVAPTGWSAEDGEVLFAMPIVGGGSIAQVIADHGPLPNDWVREVGLQLFVALQAVHDAGLVHRDVKPANLLLEATGTARPILRLSDFGIAAVIDEPRLTRAWEVVHTPGYSAPEAFEDTDPHPAQDQYSAGVVLIEMLTARRPQRTGTPEVPDGPLAPVLTRLIARDPDERFESAEAARLALAVTEAPEHRGEPVEVFSQLPAWPVGWGPSGPDRITVTGLVPSPGEPGAASRGVDRLAPKNRTAAPDETPTEQSVTRIEPAPLPPPAPPVSKAPGAAIPMSAWLLGFVGLCLVAAAVVIGVR